jgi:NAD(P)H-nitrite reductase large subunit
VVLGFGAVANDEFVRAAGLACDRGAIVDDRSRTSDPAIFAAGDCTARRLADAALLPPPTCGGRHPLYSAAYSLAVNSCAAIAIVPAAVLLMGM